MAHKICDTFGRVTKEETHARESMLYCIRLAFLSRAPFEEESVRKASDEFAERVNDRTPLSEAYKMLNEEQSADLRKMVENPALRVHGADGREWWIEESLDLLSRLERGENVGPTSERQLSRPVGTKAF